MPNAILAALAFGAPVGSITAGYNAEQDQLEQVELQGKFTKLQFLQKTEANYSSITKLLAAQTAAMSVRGVGTDSPSFNAIQRDSFNTFAKNQQNLNTEESLAELNERYEKDTVKQKFYADTLNTISSTAKEAFSFSNSLPTGG